MRKQVLAALRRTRGAIEGDRGAARLLVVNPGTLRSRMEKLGIAKEDWDSGDGLEESVPSYEDSDGRLLSMRELEKIHIANVLRHTRGRIEGSSCAAVVIVMNPSTLRSRMRKLAIHNR